MKITRTPSHRPHRSPLRFAGPLLVILLVLLLGWAWMRGGERPQTPVEKPIPADRLGR
jgi:hypothetical protein